MDDQLNGVDVLTEGPHLCLAVVNWELVRDDGTRERAWRHYYTIIATGDPKIVISAFQAGS